MSAAALLVCLLVQPCLSGILSSSEKTAEHELDPLEEYKVDTDLHPLDDSGEPELAALVESIEQQVGLANLSAERRSQTNCPASFVLLRHAGEIAGCFRVVTTRSTWDESSGVCAVLDDRAQLAVLNTPVKTSAVKAKLRGLSNAHIRTCNRLATGSISFWIAAARDDFHPICKSPFYWYPYKVPLTHGDWGVGQPNCKDQVNGASCVALNRNINYMWDDVLCSRKICSICEIPL